MNLTFDWDEELYQLFKKESEKDGICLDCEHLIKDCDCKPVWEEVNAIKNNF